MHLNHAEITGLQLGFPPAVAMTMVIDVHNPNAYDVAIRAMRGQVIIADQYPLPITFTAPGDGVWLPADKTTQVRIPIVMPVQLALAVLQKAYATPQIPYRCIGKADVTGTRTLKVEQDNYAVDEHGMIDRQQIANVIPSTLWQGQPPQQQPMPMQQQQPMPMQPMPQLPQGQPAR
jgi:hypothetical protein